MGVMDNKVAIFYLSCTRASLSWLVVSQTVGSKPSYEDYTFKFILVISKIF